METYELEHSLVLKDGSLMSLLYLDGSYRQMGEEDLAELIENIRISLSPYLSHPGHVFEITFTRDPAAAELLLDRIVGRSQREAERLGLDVSDIMRERRRHLPKWLVGESCLVAIFTRPIVLTKDETTIEVRRISETIRALPPMARSALPNKAMDGVYARHVSLVDAVATDFSKRDQSVRILNVEEALQEIRASLYPATAPHKNAWTPLIPGWRADRLKRTDGKPSRIRAAPDSIAELSALDFSNLQAPTFDIQLASEDAEIIDSQTVRIGDTLFSGFDMVVAPEVLTPFDRLVASINAAAERVSWRASFMIEAGGLQAHAIKEQYAKVLTFTSPTRNRRLREAFDELRNIDGRDDVVVRFRASFAAWAPNGHYDELRRAVSIVRRGVDRWGNAKTDGVVGDPLAAVMSSTAGIAPESTAPVAAAPLSDALALCPFSRQASPWKGGSVLFRTEDGKLWPYEPGSSEQTTWVDLFVGTPGAGKSVTMNAINFASALRRTVGASGGGMRLPRIAIIDIGPSSSGLISLLQGALPASRHHEVVYRKMRMDVSNAINPFDTQLGARRPTSTERQFITNFLAILCSSGGKAPSSAMMGLISTAVDRMFELSSDKERPAPFIPGDLPEVDEALVDTGFQVRDETIWWEVVDHLMAHDRLRPAELAHRRAVPTLSDIVTASQQEQIRTLYEEVEEDTGETLVRRFQRTVSEIVRDYPILSQPTRFEVGEASVVALDLAEVTVRAGGPDSERQTSIMYMLARHAMARDFFLDEEEILSMIRKGFLPAHYREHHVRRARSNRQMPKRICMDEFHRTGGLEAILNQVHQDIREGRKHNVQIALASQMLNDFDDTIISMATSAFICNASSEHAVKLATEAFGLNKVAQEVLRRQLNGPTEKGAPIYAVFKLKTGTIAQKLFLTLGPIELWAHSTTSEDAALRQILYEAIGPSQARELLAWRFPAGSAKRELEARIARAEEDGQVLTEQGQVSVIEQLASEMRAQQLAKN
ncbi:hypothetical protein [Amorphus sp. 3PC139-8]|uniref:hypothetical protein n=1 Tax=Amorphus sp. 3PC139-8 TaxID=2735676 RepID=UPI00345D575A